MTQILRPSPKNGLLGWPDNWTLRRYNACNEPCDMLIGPCACGAMHDADEEWVQRALELNNARIEYNAAGPISTGRWHMPVRDHRGRLDGHHHFNQGVPLMPRKIKVYKCELDSRTAYGIAVVAAYNQHEARALARWCVTAHKLDGELNGSRMLVTELPDLTYNGDRESSIILWSHHVQ